jgi:hypothetical protein
LLNKLLLAKIITSLSLDAIIATITLLHYSERICKTKEGMVKAMSRLELASPTRADIIMEELYKDLNRARQDYVRLIWRVHFWNYVMHRPVENVCHVESVLDN